MQIVLALGFVALASVSERATNAPEIPYEELAVSVLEEAGMAGVDPAGVRIEELLGRSFVRAELGLFDAHFPRAALAQDAHAQSYRKIALALLDAQRAWIAWLAPASNDVAASLADDVATVRAWVERWSPGALAAARLGDADDVLALLDAGDDVRAASARLAAAMGGGVLLGLEREEALREPLILCPRREEFVRMACFGGWLWPDSRDAFWQPSLASWSYCYLDRYKLLPLELSASPTDWRAGVSPSSRTPTGVEQQIVQLAANSMLDNYYGESVPPSLAGALSVNLVIELFGECNTRVDGDLRERRTSAREVFVPGGQSEGGVLPAHLADSRWRETHGADRFVKTLRASQAAGAKESKDKRDKHGWFLLEDDSGARRAAVHGPFLGGSAGAPAADDERFHWDRLEFLRSYRTCFVWWLQHESESTEPRSRERFATLLRNLAATDAAAVEAAIREAYDAPLSSATPGKKDLEGRFLSWLAKR